MRARTLTAALLAASAPPVLADDDRWSIDVETVAIDASGNDRRVLVDRAIGAGGAAAETSQSLDAASSFGYRAEVRRAGDRWTFGVDFLVYRTDQETPSRTGAAGGAVDLRTYVVGGGGQVSSHDPSERLYFVLLSDTTIELWAADFLASRVLLTRDTSALSFGFGLRAADFDNDYHSVVGLEEIGGLRLDASSNYDRMHGPVVALSGHLVLGRNRFEGYLGQALVFGDVELSSGLREFVGPPELDVDVDFPAIRADGFNRVESASIPMTELRLAWRYWFNDHLGVGAGGMVAAWWDLPVPPGVDAGTMLDTLDEETITLYGLSVGATVRF